MCIGGSAPKPSAGPSAGAYNWWLWQRPSVFEEPNLRLKSSALGKDEKSLKRVGKSKLQIPLVGTSFRSGLNIPSTRNERK